MMEVLFRKGRIYLVFEYVEKNLLEVLETRPQGLDVLFIVFLDKNYFPKKSLNL
jgi:hypothetical protein